jgi:uncharacterized protein (UPF0335 family)
MSVQLSEYLQLRADGVSVEEAARRSTIGLAEARLHEVDIESGDLPLPRARARAHEDQPSGETGMANETIAADELRLLIERIERVKEEIKGLNDDVRDIYAEAKSGGFDTAAMKSVIKLRKMEPHTRQEAEAVLLAYMDALGLVQSEATVALAA